MEPSGPTVVIRDENSHVGEAIEVLASGVRGTRRGLGDFLVEQGLFVGTEEYFEKSYVLRRVYEDEDAFGRMQRGVFELLDEEGRLRRWRTEEELVVATGELP